MRSTGRTSARFLGAPDRPIPGRPARLGTKHHLLVDGTGLPINATITGGNRNDVTQLLPLVDTLRPVAGKVGRPRQKFDRLLADRGYDHDKYRRELRSRGISHQIARRQTEHGSHLGRERWVVERAFAHLHWFRRLRTRWDRSSEIHQAFLSLACALICWRRLKSL